MKNTRKVLFIFILFLVILCPLSPAMRTQAAARAVKTVRIFTGRKDVSKTTLTIENGKSIRLRVAVSPKSALKKVSYKISNSKVISLKKGVIKARKPGKCRITVRVTGKNGKIKTSWIRIIVRKKVATAVMTDKKSSESAAATQTTSADQKLKILMIGNSYTYTNNLPDLLAGKLNADVTSRAVGASCLADHCESFFDDDIGHETLRILSSQKWDYVILQEQSSTPFFNYDSFSYGAKVLCQKIRKMGAKPVLFATWAYKDGSTALTQTGCTHDEMYQLLHQAFLQVAEENQMLLADAGTAFYRQEAQKNLYSSDGSHPSLEGSKLAAKIIAEAIFGDAK